MVSVENCSLCLHDNFISHSNSYIRCCESDNYFACKNTFTHLILHNEKHSICPLKLHRYGVSLSNELTRYNQAVCQTADIVFKAHMCFENFTEEPLPALVFPTDFPKVPPLINYDLVCYTVKMRRATNNHGIILFKHS